MTNIRFDSENSKCVSFDSIPKIADFGDENDLIRRIADLPVWTVLRKDFRALEEAKMNVFLSILGTAMVTILIAGAYSIGVSVGRAAAEEDNQEPVIYMEHTHGGE